VADPTALVPFHRDLIALDDEDASRNRGVALMALLGRNPPDAAARELAEKALPLLERALQRDKHDATAWKAKGSALWCLGRRTEALAAHESALSVRPNSETTLHGAANLALAMNNLENARAYLKRAIRVNPWRWQYHHLLAAVFFESGEWERAAREWRKSLRLEPFYSSSRRRFLVECYLRLGDVEQAQKEFETLLQLSPEERRPDLRRWFEHQQP